MKTTISVLFFAVTCIQCLSAQDGESFDRLMTRRRINCDDIEENSRFLIPKYHDEAKTDSIRYLLRYWKSNCGDNEPVTRLSLILDADADMINTYPFTTSTVWNMVRFKRKAEFSRKHPEEKNYYTSGLFWTKRETINDPFDLFTSVFASGAMANSKSPLASSVLEFYSGNTDSLFPSLFRNTAGNAALQSSYDSIVSDIRSEFVTYISVTAGYWVPSGNASVLGNHPEIGFVTGMMRHGYALELMFTVKFLDTPGSYRVIKNGTPTLTDQFIGVYVGGQFGVDIVRERSYDLSVLSGIAYDGFTAIPASGSNTNDAVSVNSLNLNLGLGVRYYTAEYRDAFITGEVRYNALNYVNTGGTNLSGDAWTFRVGYSFSTSWQYELLRELGAY